MHHDSRRSDHGFPDIWAVRPPRILAIELKVGRGAPSLPQLWWMEDLLRCSRGDQFTYHYWPNRKDTWAEILLTVAPPNTKFDALQTVRHMTRLTVTSIADHFKRDKRTQHTG